MPLIDELSQIETSNPTATAKGPRGKGFNIGALGRALQLIGASSTDFAQFLRTGQVGERGIQLQNLFRLQEAERRTEGLEQKRIDIAERAESRQEAEGKALIDMQRKRIDTDIKRLDLEDQRVSFAIEQELLKSGIPDLMVSAIGRISERAGVTLSREKAIEIVNSDPEVIKKRILSGELEVELGKDGVSLLIEKGRSLGFLPEDKTLDNIKNVLDIQLKNLDIQKNETSQKIKEEFLGVLKSGKFDVSDPIHRSMALGSGYQIGELDPSAEAKIVERAKKEVGVEFEEAKPLPEDLQKFTGHKTVGEASVSGMVFDPSSEPVTRFRQQLAATQDAFSKIDAVQDILKDAPEAFGLFGVAASVVEGAIAQASNVLKVLKESGFDIPAGEKASKKLEPIFSAIGVTNRRLQAEVKNLIVRVAEAEGFTGRELTDRKIELMGEIVGVATQSPAAFSAVLDDLRQRLDRSIQHRSTATLGAPGKPLLEQEGVGKRAMPLKETPARGMSDEELDRLIEQHLKGVK